MQNLNVHNFRLCCAAHMARERENVQMPCGRRDSHLLAFFLINHIKIRKKQKLEEPDFYLREELMTGSVTSNDIFFFFCLVCDRADFCAASCIVRERWEVVLLNQKSVKCRWPSPDLYLHLPREPRVIYVWRII